MKISLSKFLGLGLVFLFVFGFFQINRVLAGAPMLRIVGEGNSNVRLTVESADSYSSINLYQKSSNTSLWTVISNIGQTDSNGLYSTLLGVDASIASSIDYYVLVNGISSNIQTYTPYGGCGYSCGTGQISFSQTNVTLSPNQNLTLSIYGGYSSYYLSGNSNSSVASASVSGSSLQIYAYNSGSTQLTACANNNGCGSVYVTVTGQSGYDNIRFSETNPTLSIGQSKTVSIYSSSGYSGNYYLSGNSNANVVNAQISGSSLTLWGQNNGSSSLTICQGSNGCGSLFVNVSGYNYSGSFPQISVSSLPVAYAGQYYSYQLQAAGGSYPYTFAVSAGSLPQGLTLSSNGIISGTPACGVYPAISLQVRDSLNRVSSKDFYFQVLNCGGQNFYPYTYPYAYSNTQYPGVVAGGFTYKHGALIKENDTVYIVYRNNKTGFTNPQAFLGFGYKWSNVQSVSSSGLVNSSYTIYSSETRHPWGSWIKSGQTIYFVHELGLIPIPSWDIFLNNGGESAWVVPANAYDFSAPVLNVMTYNDARLR